MRKQVVVTLLFLIVSLSVLGMASFAWFSSNRAVTAGGMTISVQMPINIMASLIPPPTPENPGAPMTVTSLEGFKNTFQFGSMSVSDGNVLLAEYDMLVPVSSADGINFLYLPFRYIDSNGTPKSDVTPSNYTLVPEGSNIGYYIDIPLYLLTTTPLDLEVYVSHLDIGAPDIDSGGVSITGAVRAAVVLKEGDTYRSLVVAKDSGAVPLTRTLPFEKTYYPMFYDGYSAVEMSEDKAVYESIAYPPTEQNSFTLSKSEIVDGVPTYYISELHIRIWVEGSDASAVLNNAGAYFTVSMALAVNEN